MIRTAVFAAAVYMLAACHPTVTPAVPATATPGAELGGPVGVAHHATRAIPTGDHR